MKAIDKTSSLKENAVEKLPAENQFHAR
jgi:hypothetical protein